MFIKISSEFGKSTTIQLINHDTLLYVKSIGIGIGNTALNSLDIGSIPKFAVSLSTAKGS